MRRRRFSRGSGKRRSVQWGSTSVAPFSVLPGATTLFPITPAAMGTLQALGTPTLVRTVGSVQVLNTGSSGSEAFGAVGLIVASKNVVPADFNPFGTAASFDWFWHRFYWVPNISGTSVEARLQRFDLDAKAMRKVKDDEEIYFVLNNQTASAASVKVFFSCRLLVKRP